MAAAAPAIGPAKQNKTTSNTEHEILKLSACLARKYVPDWFRQMVYDFTGYP